MGVKYMSFEAKDYSIGDVLSKSVFNIPRNQRRYVWNKENWQELCEDIVFSIEGQNPHFIGSIVLKDDGKHDGLSYYTIIDGQQRIMTITLFLVAIMWLFLENGMLDEFLGTVSYIQSKNNMNKDETILKSEYHSSLESLILGILNISDKKMSITSFIDTHILSKTKDKCIGEAVKYFYGFIKNNAEQFKEKNNRLLEIRSALLDMTVVRIISSSEEDSYTIFEILNARGQELADHELLKNYIMRYIQPDNKRDIAKVKWDEMENKIGSKMNKFIKHYATHKFGDIKNKYGSPYQAIQKETHGVGISDLFDDIKLKSEYYCKLINPENGAEGNCTNIESNIFGFLKSKRSEQFRPIFLSLIHQRELGNLSDNRYEQTLKYIYNFFVCYTIIGEEKSNKLEDVVYKYARLMEQSYSDNILQEFANNLKSKLPGYEWFLNIFKTIGYSKHYDLYKDKKSKDRVIIVLEIIEKYLSQREDIQKFTIEHILPDSESIEHATIGNLIPF